MWTLFNIPRNDMVSSKVYLWYQQICTLWLTAVSKLDNEIIPSHKGALISICVAPLDNTICGCKTTNLSACYHLVLVKARKCPSFCQY